MIVPFIMKVTPSGTHPARQTASFTNASGVRQTIELRSSEELIFEDFVGELQMRTFSPSPLQRQRRVCRRCVVWATGASPEVFVVAMVAMR
jgi:hypothetical protein